MWATMTEDHMVMGDKKTFLDAPTVKKTSEAGYWKIR